MQPLLENSPMEHDTKERGVFKKGYNAVNRIVPILVGSMRPARVWLSVALLTTAAAAVQAGLTHTSYRKARDHPSPAVRLYRVFLWCCLTA